MLNMNTMIININIQINSRDTYEWTYYYGLIKNGKDSDHRNLWWTAKHQSTIKSNAT
jgi:hypothetical protein